MDSRILHYEFVTGESVNITVSAEIEAMQSPKNRLQQKRKAHTSYEVQCFFGGEYRAVSNHGELLQSMHGALPAELMPHSFGTNKSSGQTKKHYTLLCSAFLSGGEYRDRTGDLLHAMQALSQLS